MSSPLRTQPIVLTIEDDAQTREVIGRLLARAGMTVLDAADGRTALRVLHDRRPDAVILDVGLPGLDGFEVLQRIRDISDVPVLMLTGRGDHHDRVRGLDSGADDYVPKPFDGAELTSRVGALLRRTRRTSPTITTWFDDGVVHIDFEHRSVHVHGEPLTLTPTEYRLLAALVRHAGQVLSPEQLLEQAWDDPTGTASDRVKFAVLRLRRKLLDAGLDDRTPPIETVRGFGYRYRSA